MNTASEFHNALAAHHGRLGKLHKSHFESLEPTDPHALFHKACAAEHSRMSEEHHECAKAAELYEAGLPEPEIYWPGQLNGTGGGKAARSRIRESGGRPVIPDNPTVRLIARSGAEELVTNLSGADAIAALDPALRKMVE